MTFYGQEKMGYNVQLCLMNMAALQAGMEKPGEFAKLQSPGCVQVDEILQRVSVGAGAKAPAERRVWGAYPSRIDQGDK